MSLEVGGVPTAIVCTDEFRSLARLRLEAMGLPPVRVATLRHPLAGLVPEIVRARAADTVHDIIEAFAASA